MFEKKFEYDKTRVGWIEFAISDHCNFCGTKDDTFHAFAQCPCSTNWLHNILIEIDIGLHFIENVTIKEFIFGVESEGWNNIFLVLKYYLGQCRLHGKLPMVIPALHSIYQRVLADKIFKTETGFYIKWGNLSTSNTAEYSLW